MRINVTGMVDFTGRGNKINGDALYVRRTFCLTLRGGGGILILSVSNRKGASSQLTPEQRLRSNSCRPVLAKAGATRLFTCRLSNVRIVRYPYNTSLVRAPGGSPSLFRVRTIPLSRTVGPTHRLTRLFRGCSCILVSYPPDLNEGLITTLIVSARITYPMGLSNFTISNMRNLLGAVVNIHRTCGRSLRVLNVIVGSVSHSIGRSGTLGSLRGAIPSLLFRGGVVRQPPLSATAASNVPI